MKHTHYTDLGAGVSGRTDMKAAVAVDIASYMQPTYKSQHNTNHDAQSMPNSLNLAF